MVSQSNTQTNISELLGEQKIVPVVVLDNEAQTKGLSEALLNGGIKVVEVTLRSDFGVKAIELIRREFTDMVVLAGTVNNARAMQQVADAGVQGVISPGLTETLLQSAQTLQMPYLPGVSSASEILTAIEYGLTECKLFPASIAGGVDALKAFAGPFQGVNFCPTGGVDASNFQDYLALKNVMCVGGSWLAPSSMIQAGDWAQITKLCREATQSASS